MRIHHGWWVTTSSATDCRKRLFQSPHFLYLENVLGSVCLKGVTCEQDHLISSECYFTCILFTSSRPIYFTPLWSTAVSWVPCTPMQLPFPSSLPKHKHFQSIMLKQLGRLHLLIHSCKNQTRSSFPGFSAKLKEHTYQSKMFLLVATGPWLRSMDNLSPTWTKIKAKIMRKKQKAIKTHLPWWQTFLLYLQKLYFWHTLHIKHILKTNWQEEGWEHKNTAGRFGRLQSHWMLINVIFQQWPNKEAAFQMKTFI